MSAILLCSLHIKRRAVYMKEKWQKIQRYKEVEHNIQGEKQ